MADDQIKDGPPNIEEYTAPAQKFVLIFCGANDEDIDDAVEDIMEIAQQRGLFLWAAQAVGMDMNEIPDSMVALRERIENG